MLAPALLHSQQRENRWVPTSRSRVATLVTTAGKGGCGVSPRSRRHRGRGLAVVVAEAPTPLPLPSAMVAVGSKCRRPVLAAGWIFSTLAFGATAGAAAGSLINAMAGAGVSDDEANFLAETVRRGGAIVSVRVIDSHVPAVERSWTERDRSARTRAATSTCAPGGPVSTSKAVRTRSRRGRKSPDASRLNGLRRVGEQSGSPTPPR